MQFVQYLGVMVLNPSLEFRSALQLRMMIIGKTTIFFSFHVRMENMKSYNNALNIDARTSRELAQR